MPRTKKVKPVFAKRTFINDDPEMSGFILAVVDKFSHHDDDDKERVSGYPMLDIGDCSTKISLDFSFYTVEGMKRALKKARLVREVVDGFVDAIESEAKRYEEEEKERKKNATGTKTQSNNKTKRQSK